MAFNGLSDGLIARGFSVEEANRMQDELATLLTERLMQVALEKLDDAQRADIKALVEAGQAQEAASKIAILTGKEEWDKLVEDTLDPVLDEYGKKVLIK